MSITLSDALVQSIAGYLVQRPYNEVAQLIRALQEAVADAERQRSQAAALAEHEELAAKIAAGTT